MSLAQEANGDGAPVRAPTRAAVRAKPRSRVVRRQIPTLSSRSGIADDLEPGTPFAMPRPQRPIFPSRVFDIRDHGAIEGGDTDCTAAIAKAIKACARSGGGRVLIPPGVFLTGCIHLRSNVELHLAQGATLRFSTQPQDYLPAVFVRWSGLECYNFSPFIYARDCDN